MENFRFENFYGLHQLNNCKADRNYIVFDVMYAISRCLISLETTPWDSNIPSIHIFIDIRLRNNATIIISRARPSLKLTTWIPNKFIFISASHLLKLPLYYLLIDWLVDGSGGVETIHDYQSFSQNSYPAI